MIESFLIIESYHKWQWIGFSVTHFILESWKCSLLTHMKLGFLTNVACVLSPMSTSVRGLV